MSDITIFGADRLDRPFTLKVRGRLWDIVHDDVNGLFSRIDKIEIDCWGSVATWVPAMDCAGQQLFRKTAGPS